jgi:lipoate-protein ligase B
VRELWVVSLGLTPYEEALELQRALARERISGAIPEDMLLLVEHPPVVTMGRSAKARNLISSNEFLASKGVQLFEVERGGDVTFHGPGQLVGYPIIDLKRHRQDLHWFLRQVEEALIQTLAAYSIPGERRRLHHRRVDERPQDRIHRRSRPRLGHVAWLCAECHDRSFLLRSDNPVWNRWRDDDVNRA